MIPDPLESLQGLLERLDREIGRRGLLRASASGFGLLLLGGLLPAGCRSYPEPPVVLKFFTPEEYAVVQAISRAMLGLEGDAVDVAAEVDRLVAGMDRAVQRDIGWILRIFEHGTHVFDLKGKRFTRLERPEQEIYLAGWMESSMGARRIVFRALKLMASLGYYGSPKTWRAIGYDGPWLGRREEPRVVEYEKAVALDVMTRG
jgi:hypothetical protein